MSRISELLIRKGVNVNLSPDLIAQANPMTGDTVYSLAALSGNDRLASMIRAKIPNHNDDNESIPPPSYASRSESKAAIEDLSEIELLRLLASKYKGSSIKDAFNALHIAAEDYMDDEKDHARPKLERSPGPLPDKI